VVDWAHARREARWQLDEVRRRLTTAEDALGEVQAALKEAEFDAAAARVTEAERALDAAMAERGEARRKRHAARQVYERATTVVAAPAPHRRNRRPAETDAVSHRRAGESSPVCQRPRQTRFGLHSQPIEMHHRAEHWWMVQEVLCYCSRDDGTTARPG
jgi:chromosome segregation ATPase